MGVKSLSDDIFQQLTAVNDRIEEVRKKLHARSGAPREYDLLLMRLQGLYQMRNNLEYALRELNNTRWYKYDDIKAMILKSASGM